MYTLLSLTCVFYRYTSLIHQILCIRIMLLKIWLIMFINQYPVFILIWIRLKQCTCSKVFISWFQKTNYSVHIYHKCLFTLSARWQRIAIYITCSEVIKQMLIELLLPVCFSSFVFCSKGEHFRIMTCLDSGKRHHTLIKVFWQISRPNTLPPSLVTSPNCTNVS